MRESIEVTGMVLLASPVGDYDKRLVILTKERGKITAFARGARRQNSMLLAAANPFVFGTFRLYEGRSAYNLIQANVRNYFTELVTEYPGVYYGFYFLEFADYYGQEENDESQMINLLYASLRALLRPSLDDRLVRRIFELKAMVINGEYPQVFSCNACGSRENIEGISMRAGAVYCASCTRLAPDLQRISPSALYAMQYIIASPIEKLYTFTVTPEILRELSNLIDRCVHSHVEKHFKSLEILSVMK